MCKYIYIYIYIYIPLNIQVTGDIGCLRIPVHALMPVLDITEAMCFILRNKHGHSNGFDWSIAPSVVIYTSGAVYHVNVLIVFG